jgi:NAD-dependent dihydropyrimidine dehydrogenase PreA subunit
MKRSIISIDQEKCDGCGLCVPDCPEGALQIIDGKARLVSDLFCDGLGACIKTCPRGAIAIEEREALPYDERRVMETIVKQGPLVIKAHLEHLDEHGEDRLLAIALEVLREKGLPIPALDRGHDPSACACPGSAARDLRGAHNAPAREPAAPVASQLAQWPVQLKLLNPAAPYFDNADLLLAADCVPFAYADFHRRLLAGRIVITFCPKLDPYADEYVDKLAAILTMHEIRSITIARMEVPCCGGVGVILQRAMQKAGKSFMVREQVISIRGEIV